MTQAQPVFWTMIALLIVAYNLCGLVDWMQARRKPDRMVLLVAGLAVSIGISSVMMLGLLAWRSL